MSAQEKVYKMPPELREELERILISRNHAGYKALSAWLKEKGFYLSHTSIWNFDKKLRRELQRIKATTEAARILSQNMPDNTAAHSAGVLALVESNLFQSLLEMNEAFDGTLQDKIRIYANAARALSETTRASISQKKWADEFNSKLKILEENAKKEGKRLDKKTLQAVRETLYGH